MSIGITMFTIHKIYPGTPVLSCLNETTLVNSTDTWTNSISLYGRILEMNTINIQVFSYIMYTYFSGVQSINIKNYLAPIFVLFWSVNPISLLSWTSKNRCTSHLSYVAMRERSTLNNCCINNIYNYPSSQCHARNVDSSCPSHYKLLIFYLPLMKLVVMTLTSSQDSCEYFQRPCYLMSPSFTVAPHSLGRW